MSVAFKLGFLASRNGSGFRAIVEACETGLLAAEPRLLVANTAKADALNYAKGRGLATQVIPTAGDSEIADQRLCDALSAADVDLVILSGYLRRMGPVTLARFRNRVLNIHPGPLPAFGGEGMYGLSVHEAVISSGVSESCATIHLVDDIYDHGTILDRVAVPIEPGETATSLEAKVTALEPRAFVALLSRLVSGDVQLPD
jgi:phosphoribosylglycinamide formyltransferase-1